MSSYCKVVRILDRDQAIQGLISLRESWQEAGAGQSLLEIQSSVGLILADIAGAIGLYPEEQEQALGAELYQELLTLQELSVDFSLPAEL